MKKILLFALPILAMCFASCEKDNGNNGEELSGDDVIQFKDPNFLKALLVVRETDFYDYETGEYIPYTMDVDKNKDGQITVNEAKDVKVLELYDYDSDISFDITDISEIKYFTSLEYLDCSYNQLTSLNVSKNTALTGLYCEFNKLTSLDVSNNSALTGLECDDNKLTSLDVSKNTALTKLLCRGNQFTSLDVSKNTALTGLYSSYNQLTSLNVSGCTALTDLECVYTQLTSLDVSGCTALERVNCFNNQLISLNVSGCTSLEYLSCDNNQLTSLTISNGQQDKWWVNSIKYNYPNINIIVK